MDNAYRQAQRITVYTDCTHMAAPCLPGLELLRHVQAAIDQASVVSDDFSLEGRVCMARCARPCTIAFQATSSATFVFGDMSDEADIGELVSLARLHQASQGTAASDGRCADRIGDKTLGRRPAAILGCEQPRTLLQ